MATRLKPSRINVDNTPRVGDGAAYQNDNDFHWSMGGGDMSYRDFEWHTLTGTSLVIEEISNNITPSSDFTVSAGTVKPGIEYVLRVNTGNTPYTMTLGTGVTNPNGYSTELTPNKVNQFKFIATSDSQLELEGVDTSDFVTLGTQQTITAKKTFNVEPELGIAKTTDATNDGTKFATEAQVYKKADDNKVVHNTGNETVAGVKTFSSSPVVPAPTNNTDAATKKYVDDNIASATAGAVSDAAYDATTWDGVTGIAPSKNAVRDKIVTMDSAISGNTSNISTINGKIPSEASTSNQLADKAYVGDSINSVTAYYITKNANGDQFATYAELAAATTFYSGGVVRVPTKNDYTIVLDDENHDHATTRYIYNNGWEYQYTVNETALTQAQLNALNSGITAAKVSQYDGYATNKQDKLVNQTNIKSINNNSLLGSGNITLNDVKVSSTAPASPTEGMVWYDTTNDQLKVYDGANWNVTGKEYNAGKGIEIKNGPDYSAMQGPCPNGFHIGTKDEWQALINILTTLSIRDANDSTHNAETYLKLPSIKSVYPDSGNVYNTERISYWTSTSAGNQNGNCISRDSSGGFRVSYTGESNVKAIRPFKNTSVTPDNTWTTLYDGSSVATGAGVFHNSSLGVISLSGNGTTWITISDKNLGATAVYNYGDTKSESNCGKRFSWGNCYGFAYGVSLVKTSTLVDASNYGPGNYYSSSTRISNGGKWESSDNTNLRGGVTGVVTLENAITNTGVLSVNGQTGNVTTHTTITVTLTSAGWSSNSQTVSATGVTASNTVIVSPAPSDIGDYADCGVYCSAQGSGTLTFGCDTAPSGDIVVNVLIMS